MEETVPTKAAPRHGGEGHFAHRIPYLYGRGLSTRRTIASPPNRTIQALSRDANDTAFCGGKMRNLSNIFNSFTAL